MSEQGSRHSTQPHHHQHSFEVTHAGNSPAAPMPGLIDTHIHLDQYSPEQQTDMMGQMNAAGVQALLSVSMHLASSRSNLALAQQYPGKVLPAFGYHPEQALPTADELEELFHWIEQHQDHMIAVGEVGLPYYLAQEKTALGEVFDRTGHIELLEQFVMLAARYRKPIILHAVYEDAEIACDLLEKHQVQQAHFHWFKGERTTIQRMAINGYYISFTPDIAYEEEIQTLALQYPPHLVMSETDGPWPFEGPFAGQTTSPGMVSEVIRTYSRLTGMQELEARSLFYANACRLYGL